jgi:thiol:disulfide interchange protein DsbD
MKTIPAVFFLLLLSPLNVLSWGAGNVVSVRAIGSGETLKAGQPYEFTLELTIANPYHINSDHPLQDFLIPTSLEFEPQPGITFGKIVFPQATIKKLPVSDSPMALFEGTVKIAAEFIPSSNPVNKDVTIRGKIRYQACNDRVCLPPVWQSFSVALSSDLPAMTRASSSLPLSGNPETVDFYRKGMIATFLLVFLGGLALNLTPAFTR